jgi:hypothetical protein
MKENKLFLYIEELLKQKNFIFIILTGLLLPVVFFIVYQTGGTKYGFVHLMYVPIIMAGMLYSAKVGVLYALIGGFLLGPYMMPLDRLTNESQSVSAWILQMVMFIIVGGLVGVSAELLKRRNYIIKALWSQNQETEIPNIRSLSMVDEKKYQQHPLTMITVIINNYQSIIDVFGIQVYYKFLGQTYLVMKKAIPNDALIIQDDANKFQLLQSIRYCCQICTS